MMIFINIPYWLEPDFPARELVWQVQMHGFPQYSNNL